MVLVDTSVWIEHFREGCRELETLLEEGSVFCHPFVIGELACGNLKNRDTILTLLQALPQAPEVANHEVLAFIDSASLAGKGLGLIDVHLLASARLAGIRLWTRDRRLADVAVASCYRR